MQTQTYLKITEFLKPKGFELKESGKIKDRFIFSNGETTITLFINESGDTITASINNNPILPFTDETITAVSKFEKFLKTKGIIE